MKTAVSITPATRSAIPKERLGGLWAKYVRRRKRTDCHVVSDRTIGRLKSKEKCFSAGCHPNGLPALCLNDLVAQLQPAAQLRWCALDRTRPTTSRERPFQFGKGSIFSKNEQGQARAFGKRQLKITAV